MRTSAVTTTGIYCRPECGASPLPANTTAYLHPAAAEAAGFRACLRCRPYRRGDVAWATGPEVVCRAVRLVIGGALDDSTEDDLARRVGVSARHLRRLFAEHVGATPDQLARSRRAHFARRLLDDTDLTITDVAHASGFGSVRQMNRQMQATFRASPTALRRRRRASDRLVADGGLGLRVPFAPPLEWQAMLGFLGDRAVEGMEAVDVDAGTYRRTLAVDGHPAVVEARLGGDDHLVLTVHLPRWEGLIHVVEQARRAFALDLDTEAVQRDLGHDRVVGASVRGRPGLRVPGVWEPWEAVLRGVLGQQVSVGRATTMVTAVVDRLGERAEGLTAMKLDRLLPPASVVADDGGAALKGLGLPASRERAVVAAARAVAEGAVVLDGSWPLERVVDGLCDVPGIGPWTAHYVALRLGEPDAFPAGDAGLARAMSARGATIAPDRLADGWRPWRALATAHLWLGEAPAVGAL